MSDRRATPFEPKRAAHTKEGRERAVGYTWLCVVLLTALAGCPAVRGELCCCSAQGMAGLLGQLRQQVFLAHHPCLLRVRREAVVAGLPPEVAYVPPADPLPCVGAGTLVRAAVANGGGVRCAWRCALPPTETPNLRREPGRGDSAPLYQVAHGPEDGLARQEIAGEAQFPQRALRSFTASSAPQKLPAMNARDISKPIKSQCEACLARRSIKYTPC